MAGLKFTGDGTRVLPGSPPRDLLESEVKKFGGYDYLIASGLYEAKKPAKKRAKKSEVDNGNN